MKSNTVRILLLILGLGVASGVIFASPENPLVTVAAVSAALIIACFFAGAVSGDYSWVDRLWSVVPLGYAWIYAAYSEFAPPLLAMALLVTLWGARLTFNFARRGGYSGYEDYRWGVLRRRIGNPILWQLFNFFFISLYQHALFVLFTLPLYVAYLKPEIREPGLFTGAAVAFAGFLIFETVADEQQWNFQQTKYARARTSGAAHSQGREAGERRTRSKHRKAEMQEDIRRGFFTHGLFHYSRHPNYFGELGLWWMVYLCSVGVSGVWLHPGAAGPLLLTLLFLGSTRFTESITASKYKDYQRYRRFTSMIVPLPNKGEMEETSTAGSPAAGGDSRDAENSGGERS